MRESGRARCGVRVCAIILQAEAAQRLHQNLPRVRCGVGISIIIFPLRSMKSQYSQLDSCLLQVYMYLVVRIAWKSTCDTLPKSRPVRLKDKFISVLRKSAWQIMANGATISHMNHISIFHCGTDAPVQKTENRPESRSLFRLVPPPNRDLFRPQITYRWS